MTDAELGGKNNSLKISKTVSTYPLGEVSQVIPFAFRIVIVKSNLALSFNDLIFFIGMLVFLGYGRQLVG